MSRWFRHYAGMMRDEKFVRVAIKTGQSVERVLWVWGAILESAAEVNDDGRYDLDPAEIAYFLRADEADIRAVLDALATHGRVDGDRVVHWGDRQFESDRSAARQAEYRKRKRQPSSDGDGDCAENESDGVVTAASRHGDAPETETETETETEKREARARRAARLPDDWKPNPDDWKYALKLGFAPSEIHREAEKFENYWRAKAGRDAAKLDWSATWRNWLLRAIESRGGRPAATSPPVPLPPDWPARAGYFQRNGRWLDEWGDREDIPAEFRGLFLPRAPAQEQARTG